MLIPLFIKKMIQLQPPVIHASIYTDILRLK